jgi:hypothetical protein
MRALAGLAAALLAACSTPPPAASCSPYDTQATGALPVSLLSPELGTMIGVRDVTVSNTPAQLPAVQVAMFNCTDVDVAVLVRTRFSGERGQSEPPSAWRTVILAPRAEASYSESAVSRETKKVVVDILDAQRAQQFYTPGQYYLPPAPAR